ncbi:MAG TPA: hypothetical protein VN821_16880 [Candidatus Udaeobacter sp.]|nr:hypothetical protein [Candidatus Udaeobacter sp.]
MVYFFFTMPFSAANHGEAGFSWLAERIVAEASSDKALEALTPSGYFAGLAS